MRTTLVWVVPAGTFRIMDPTFSQASHKGSRWGKHGAKFGRPYPGQAFQYLDEIRSALCMYLC